ncbi:hypothetical protein E3Q10_04401 [Wallemia mellicola]|uniref:GATA-type domain-containing protein n=1 Tax=Wallemia mellicola TaxID=1708541 RepID=A0A4V4MSM9_9BASI|nr:hypothetical protein E3Q10_04401 [Wallemia mellicola]
MKGEIPGVSCNNCSAITSSLWRRHPITNVYLCNVCKSTLIKMRQLLYHFVGGLNAYQTCGKATPKKRKKATKRKAKGRKKRKSLPCPDPEFTVYQDDDYRAIIPQKDQKVLNEVTNIQIPHEVVIKTYKASTIVNKKSTTENSSTLISNHTFSLSEMFSIKSEPTLAEPHDPQVKSSSSSEQFRGWHNFMDINEQTICDSYPDPFADDYNIFDINMTNII